MNFTALLGLLPLISKAAFLLRSPELIKKIIELIISGILFAELFYKDLPGADQKVRAIDFICKLYDTIDIEFALPNSTDRFVKEEFIPKAIDFIVYVMKNFKPKETITPKLN